MGDGVTSCLPVKARCRGLTRLFARRARRSRCPSESGHERSEAPNDEKQDDDICRFHCYLRFNTCRILVWRRARLVDPDQRVRQPTKCRGSASAYRFRRGFLSDRSGTVPRHRHNVSVGMRRAVCEPEEAHNDRSSFRSCTMLRHRGLWKRGHDESALIQVKMTPLSCDPAGIFCPGEKGLSIPSRDLRRFQPTVRNDRSRRGAVATARPTEVT